MKSAFVTKVAAAVLLLAGVVFLPGARANSANEGTKVTFSQPVQLPGRVLPAGTYWFILPNAFNDRDQVRVYSADRTVFYGTFITADAERVKVTDKTQFTLVTTDPSQPQSVITWFYPGETSGHQFIYSKQEEKEFAKSKQVTAVAGD